MSGNHHRLTKSLRPGFAFAAIAASGVFPSTSSFAQHGSRACPPVCPPACQPPCPPCMIESKTAVPSEASPTFDQPTPTRPSPVQPAPSRFADVDPRAFAMGPGAGTASAAASRRLPNVIADSPLGTCATIKTDDIPLNLAHPNLQCSRLNLAENNSPIPTDRLFVTYRHFENPTRVGAYGGVSTGPLVDIRSSYSFDVEQILFGLERTACDGLVSLEVRLPFVVQLSSDIDLFGLENVPDAATANQVISDALSERFEIGNLSLVFKGILAQTNTCTLSGGVGFLLPTARDVSFAGVIDNVDFGGNAGIVDLDFAINAANETIDVLPFLAYSLAPDGCFFSQGFLQIAVPVNSSRTRLAITSRDVDGDGVITPFSPDIEGIIGRTGILAGQNAIGIYDSTIQGQTLMRLNLQFGCWLYDNPCRDTCLDRIAALLEFHWTSTLNDTNEGIAQIVPRGAIDPPNDRPINIRTGNPANRVDVVNCTIGGSFEKGLTSLLPAVTIPLSSGDNKAFDYEAAILFNRRF